MKTPAQQYARELSRMRPRDRALSKALRRTPHDGSFRSLKDLIARALIAAHEQEPIHA